MADTLKKLEFFFIFLALPSIIFLFDSTIIVFLTLYLVFILSLVILYFDKTFLLVSLKKKIDWKFVSIFTVSFICLGFIYVLLIDKNLLFIFPKTNFKLWLVVIIVYPFLSVIPQEIVYRVFFFQRYFPKNNNSNFLIILNMFVFSYGHLVFNNFKCNSNHCDSFTNIYICLFKKVFLNLCCSSLAWWSNNFHFGPW